LQAWRVTAQVARQAKAQLRPEPHLPSRSIKLCCLCCGCRTLVAWFLRPVPNPWSLSSQYPPHQYLMVYAVEAVSAVFAVIVIAVVLSAHVLLVIIPVAPNVLTMQLAWFECVFGKFSVARVPVVGLVPVVSVTVPLTPSHTWLVAHAMLGPDPAAAPAATPIVPVPMMNFPCRKPVAVVFPLPVT
jgi:hypothetical protein